MEYIKVLLLKLLGSLGDYLKVIFQTALKEELKVVMPIATTFVKQVASDPTLLTGAEKRAVAFKSILDQLSSSQAQIGTSVVNLAIELAVQNMKK
jgi:hypothetical protein